MLFNRFEMIEAGIAVGMSRNLSFKFVAILSHKKERRPWHLRQGVIDLVSAAKVAQNFDLYVVLVLMTSFIQFLTGFDDPHGGQAQLAHLVLSATFKGRTGNHIKWEKICPACDPRCNLGLTHIQTIIYSIIIGNAVHPQMRGQTATSFNSLPFQVRC